MPITEQQVQALIEAWQADFNETLSPEVARSEAERLLEFFAQFAEGFTLIRCRQKEAEKTGDGGIRKAWEKTMRLGR